MQRHAWLGASLCLVVLWAACSNDQPNTLTTLATSSSSTGSGGAGGAGGGGGSPPTCTELCTSIFQCGLDGTPQNCAGFDMADQQLFLNGANSDGCVSLCNTEQMALTVLVNPGDCAGTVSSLKAVDDHFACVCDMGVSDPACNVGGAGGAGGGGGAGGN